MLRSGLLLSLFACGRVNFELGANPEDAGSDSGPGGGPPAAFLACNGTTDALILDLPAPVQVRTVEFRGRVTDPDAYAEPTRAISISSSTDADRMVGLRVATRVVGEVVGDNISGDVEMMVGIGPGSLAGISAAETQDIDTGWHHYIGVVDDAVGEPPDGIMMSHLDVPSVAPPGVFIFAPMQLPALDSISLCRDPRRPDTGTPGFVGLELDWVRFSSVVRYRGAFVAAPDAPNPDPETIALVTFGDGTINAHGLGVTTIGAPAIRMP